MLCYYLVKPLIQNPKKEMSRPFELLTQKINGMKN